MLCVCVGGGGGGGGGGECMYVVGGCIYIVYELCVYMFISSLRI